MRYRKWTEEDHELIRCMSSSGFTVREIAAEMDCSISTIEHKRRVLGICRSGGKSGRPKEYTKEQLIEIIVSLPLYTLTIILTVKIVVCLLGPRIEHTLDLGRQR